MAPARSLPPLHGLLLTCCLLVGGLSQADAQTAAPGAESPPAIPAKCIGDEPLPMVPGGLQAWLDETDRGEVMAALMAKYSTLQHDGLDAQALLLWRHPAGDWRYAALIPDLRTPGRTCVAASFSAAAVAPTAAMLRKYFFASGDRS